MPEGQLPQNIEAERGVLGSIIIDPEAIVQVADFLTPQDFYRDAHQTIYDAIIRLYEHHEPADFITICDELERTKKLSDVGGSGYITSLINEVPTSGNIEYYARIVTEKAERRRLIRYAGQVAALAYSDESDNPMQEAEKMLYGLSAKKTDEDFVDMDMLATQFMTAIDDRANRGGEPTGVPTGFPDLDRMLDNLNLQNLSVFAARPGVGKTAWGLTVAYNAACKGKRVAFFSLEMPVSQLANRLMSMVSNIPLQRLRTAEINEGDWGQLIPAMEKVRELPISIDDAARNTISTIRSKLRRLELERGKVDLIVVDYLQILTSDDGSKRNMNREQEVSALSSGLREIAKEFNVAVLALAQLNRAVESRQSKIPMLSDLRESGTIEQDASVIMFLYRDEIYNPETDRKNQADIIVAKQRNGPIGTVVTYYKADTTTFYPLEKIAEQNHA